MKLYTTNRINALGLKGPEQTHKHFPQANLIQVDNDNIQESEQILYTKANEIFQQKEKPIFIGGDHSITYPLVKAFQKQNKNPFLIVFDAHLDCDFCTKEPTHEEWLRATVKQGFPGEKIIIIGARKMWDNEKEFIDSHNIKLFKTIKDTLPIIEGHDLYISIDIDALDPLFAPAVNYPEPNGLTSKEFFDIFRQLLKQNPKAIDTVEAVLEKDKNNKTLKLITKIIEDITNHQALPKERKISQIL